MRRWLVLFSLILLIFFALLLWFRFLQGRCIVVSRLITNGVKQNPMDPAKSGRGKVIKSLLVQEHHVLTGLFGFYEVQRFTIPNIQLVPQNRDIFV